MRSWLPICVALMLCGCNMVHSDHPLFAAADGAAVPAFRTGVWATPDPACDFDPNLPLARWPGCAHGQAYNRGDPEMQALLLVPGRPSIMQFGGGKPGGPPNKPLAYFFFGVDVLRRDADGRIVAMKTWPVECGPPRPIRPNHKGPTGTLAPWPGLIMDADGDNCTATSTEPVRAAAALSRPASPAVGGAYWVRDGDD